MNRVLDFHNSDYFSIADFHSGKPSLTNHILLVLMGCCMSKLWITISVPVEFNISGSNHGLRNLKWVNFSILI